MRNVSMKVNGSQLVITIDLSAKGEPSKSGKSEVVASTGGNVAIADSKGNQFKVGVNVFK